MIRWQETLIIPGEANLCDSAIDLILRLCCGPSERFGSEGSAQIKQHPFFSHIEFGTLRQKSALYTPQIRYPTDTSNFDAVDAEKLLSSLKDSGGMTQLENGKHPEHAFYEFTFRRFFDDDGQPIAMKMIDDSNNPVFV